MKFLLMSSIAQGADGDILWVITILVQECFKGVLVIVLVSYSEGTGGSLSSPSTF